MDNASSKHAVQAILLLRSELAQREARMSAAFHQQIQALQREASRFRREVAGIVDSAGARIAGEARDAVMPVAQEYERAVSATSAHLHGASRTVWLWFGATGSILLLVLLTSWAVLGHYRRELAVTQAELRRHENAIPVLQAFQASDA
ncbi:hypothetical protein EBB59_13165, partial [Lysobacter pythonis]